MTIQLIFKIQRETFRVEIKGKEVYYLDRKMKRATRLIPKDAKIEKRILMSRNKIPKNIVQMFELNEKEQKEYDSCNTEEDIAKICIEDCKKQGSELLKKEVINEKTN